MYRTGMVRPDSLFQFDGAADGQRHGGIATLDWNEGLGRHRAGPHLHLQRPGGIARRMVDIQGPEVESGEAEGGSRFAGTLVEGSRRLLEQASFLPRAGGIG